jgi:xanthine dehydrogenase molybdopterin-binding subunit B
MTKGASHGGCGAGTYKIPTINDIPIDFRVTLLKDAPNDRLPFSFSSKAIGEPPLFLGASVYHALKVRSPTPGDRFRSLPP